MNDPPKRVLVADDEKHIQRLVQVNLQRQGWHVDVADDGRGAIELLKDAHYDLAVVDLMMPFVDGLEVLKWIRSNEKTKDLFVILMSAKAEGLRNEDIPNGPDLWLEKPLINFDWFDRFQ